MKDYFVILVFVSFFLFSNILTKTIKSEQGLANGQWYLIEIGRGGYCFSYKNFPKVMSEPCDKNDDNQKLRLDRNNDEWYNLVTKTGHYLDYDQINQQTLLIVKDRNNNPRQLWGIKGLRDKIYFIENQSTHLAIGWNPAGYGTQLLLGKITNGLADQEWKLVQFYGKQG